jgi:hypothetical protein
VVPEARDSTPDAPFGSSGLLSRYCEEHGWMHDRADPHARESAFDIARRDPPPGVSPEAAAVAIAEVLDSIGDTCPECPHISTRG